MPHQTDKANTSVEAKKTSSQINAMFKAKSLTRWPPIAIAFILILTRLSFAEPPRPLPDHPGNVFIEGEPVSVRPPQAHTQTWRLVDYDGRTIKSGQITADRVTLGPLPIGWYELVSGDDSAPLTNRRSLAVLAPLKQSSTASSPIAMDVAMAWFYDAEKMPAAANLCALTGVSWVRDRLRWDEVEPQRGQFAHNTRYDKSAQIQTAAGLRQLQVMHMSPDWANPNRKRFPLNLRDGYRFWREIARRWQGQMLAFEPWNEADVETFGGHTGAEIASLQKAAWHGLKSGNPNLIVCQNVFAVQQPQILEDFHANRAWPYFDTFNFHHYVQFDVYPRWYAAFRAVSAGRPLWVTECSLPVRWTGDEQFKEPSPPDLKIQAERVAKTFATALHEQPAMVFYFLFPHYVEGQIQFGIVRPDLSPRPAYCALAAVGRLLAEASPLGRLKTPDQSIRAYWFTAKPDGLEREIVVAWSESNTATLRLPTTPILTFDHLGRTNTVHGNELALTQAPLFALLPTKSNRQADLEPPPPPAAFLKGKPSPVVFHALWPKESVSLADSAYNIQAGKTVQVPLAVYNFSDKPVSGKLQVDAPQNWHAKVQPELQLPPNSDINLQLELTPPSTMDPQFGRVTITGEFGPDNQSVLSLRFKLNQ